MQYYKFSYLIMFALICLGSCSLLHKKTNESNDVSSLNHKKWQLISLGKNRVPETVNGRIPYLELTDTLYSANAGCNTFNGRLNTTGKKVSFSRGISTLMACPQMEMEKNLSEALLSTTHYAVMQDTLILFNKTKQNLATFKLMASSRIIDQLTGTWELEYISGPRIAFDGLYPSNKPTLSITADGKLSGNSSCNRYTGSYTKNQNQLHFGPIASTKMACAGNGESVYFKTLEKITAFSVEQDKLTLIADDIALMRFHRK